MTVLSGIREIENSIAVDEMGRDDLRRRAKQLLVRNGWQPGDVFSAHSTVELMIALATDAVRTPPDRCSYPECGCCHDATCAEAFSRPLADATPEQSPLQETRREADGSQRR